MQAVVVGVAVLVALFALDLQKRMAEAATRMTPRRWIPRAVIAITATGGFAAGMLLSGASNPLIRACWVVPMALAGTYAVGIISGRLRALLPASRREA